MTALAFSPDGTTLASSAHKTIHLRSIDGKTVDSLACDFPRVMMLAFIDDNRFFAGGGVPGVSGTVTLFTNKAATRHFTGWKDLVTSVACNSNSLAIASADHTAAIQPLSNGQTIVLTGHSGPVLAIAFSPDGQMVITGSADRSIKVWSREGALLRSFNHHTEAVHALAVRTNENGQFECASGSDDGTVRIWQPAIGRMVRIIRSHGGPIFALAYTSKALFSAGKEGIVRRLDLESDTILAEHALSSDVIYSLAVSPSGRKLAVGNWSGELQIVNLD